MEDIFEKAKRNLGKLVKVIITDKNGKQRSVWKKASKDQPKIKNKKQKQEKVEGVKKQNPLKKKVPLEIKSNKNSDDDYRDEREDVDQSKYKPGETKEDFKPGNTKVKYTEGKPVKARVYTDEGYQKDNDAKTADTVKRYNALSDEDKKFYEDYVNRNYRSTAKKTYKKGTTKDGKAGWVGKEERYK